MEQINITEILQMIPHRYPMMLVDRILEYVPGKSIIEAMAQVSAVLVAKTINAKAGEKTVFFMTIDNTKFRQVVQPGDALHIYAKIEQNRGDVWKFSAEAKVDGKVVAESSFSAMVRDR